MSPIDDDTLFRPLTDEDAQEMAEAHEIGQRAWLAVQQELAKQQAADAAIEPEDAGDRDDEA
jgi:hypothetical protein